MLSLALLGFLAFARASRKNEQGGQGVHAMSPKEREELEPECFRAAYQFFHDAPLHFNTPSFFNQQAQQLCADVNDDVQRVN